MKTNSFDEQEALHDLKHYLPAQASLKDFVHHNTLHAFQHKKFFEGIQQASQMFGYQVSLKIEEYRALYNDGAIRHDILDQILDKKKGEAGQAWKEKLLEAEYKAPKPFRVGQVRRHWKELYKIDMDALVHPLLFRLLCSFLDQGMALWHFPAWNLNFIQSMSELELRTYSSIFRNKEVKEMIYKYDCDIAMLLDKLIGDPSLYKQYLFDQQFAHQGWSGLVSVIESQPETLIDTRLISVKELIQLELLMEYDVMLSYFGKKQKPMAERLKKKPLDLFAPSERAEYEEVMELWQEAYEWSFYDAALGGIKAVCALPIPSETRASSFQALFCIDDREGSLRHYLDEEDPKCKTYGTPGFFGFEFYFKPMNAKFVTKLCPAPVFPSHVIHEVGSNVRREQDMYLHHKKHSLVRGWFITQTLGFWAAVRLAMNIFHPAMGPATSSSFRHMDTFASLTFENIGGSKDENGLLIGYTTEEMAHRLENALRSINLTANFASIVYAIGHGASSVNNPHYAAYDCGACSGRAGSVNARIFCYAANHPKVREILRGKGIDIPHETQFLGGLHDTTRDEIAYFDEQALSFFNQQKHKINKQVFEKALAKNAKERSRRFLSVNSKESPEKVQQQVRLLSVSLFEPRPELNHATNALCIVGRRYLTKKLFLDRRAFLNSYDYRSDLEGKALFGVMKPLGPVCGGINLEYFFSRTDNQKLGAGSKLPHNVMGLIAVANGTDGDLRPGLPGQMIEVHDPIRLLMIVEHFPEVVLNPIRLDPAVYEWYRNEWIILVAVHPETAEQFVFREEKWMSYAPVYQPAVADSLARLAEESHENLPVLLTK